MDFAKPDLNYPFKQPVRPETLLLLNKLSEFFDRLNVEANLVGGWVRDTLLGRDTSDIDIAVDADALEIAPKIAAFTGGKSIVLDRENHIARVILPAADNQDVALPGSPTQLDISTLDGSIRQDLNRRDFTINAMAVSLNRLNQAHSDAKIIDPFGGRADLQSKTIKAVTPTIFQSDALRLLRAVRIGAELGFTIDQHTESLIKQHSQLISGVAGERVREELVRLLAVFGAAPVRYLDELGLLTALIPELVETKGVEQPGEHHWDVFEHSLRTVEALEYLFRRGNWEYGSVEVLAAVPWSRELADHFEIEAGFGSTRRSLLKLSALLHDINKPHTRTVDEDGRIRFLGHALEGAARVAQILERLRFSAKEIKLVEIEVMHHMRPTQLSNEGMPTNRAIYRYFRDTGVAGIDILFLNLADHLATRGPDLNFTGWQEHAQLVDYILRKRFEQEKLIIPPKLANGYDIINILRTASGPEVGELLELVREAQASGEITTREEALSFIERLKKKNA